MESDPPPPVAPPPAAFASSSSSSASSSSFASSAVADAFRLPDCQELVEDAPLTAQLDLTGSASSNGSATNQRKRKQAASGQGNTATCC